MKKRTLRNAIEAHGWVGVILSLPLFIVFWAGAISLFLPEVTLWSRLPVLSADAPPPTPPTLRDMLDHKLSQLPERTDEAIWLFPAGERSPFIQLFVPLKETGVETDDHDGIVLDSSSGATVTGARRFKLATFLFELHFNFNLSQGSYIVGVVSLFFLVLLMTGIVVQLKNLVADFFLYRHERGKRQRLNDIHTVAGVLTLPFATLYALTGLMFNLSILFQLPSLMLVYGGDQEKLMGDAGYAEYKAKPAAGVKAEMPQLEPLIQQLETAQNARVTSLSLTHFGDENAVVELQAERRSGFPQRLVQAYEVKTRTFHEVVPTRTGQTFSLPVDTLLKLHVARFGGSGVRFLFYLLALGICGMIVAGNLLWLAKREAKRAKYPRSFAVVRGVTLGGCVGAVLATSLSFALERTLPASFAPRSYVVLGAFLAVLALVTLAGFFIRKAKPFLRNASWLTALLLLVPPLIDLIAYRPQLATLWQRGHHAPTAVTLAFAIHAALFTWLATRLSTKSHAHKPSESNEAEAEAESDLA